jgi:hypothetical protein
LIQLSEHFSLQEMGYDVPAAAIPTFQVMCTQILEPIREYVETKIYISSGYRSLLDNQQVHGQVNSEHMATADYCAVDFFCPNVQSVFVWLTQNPVLPYHQCILEKGKLGFVIHVSYNRLKPGVRSVLTGATHNSEKYQPVTHVAFNPVTPETTA